MRVALACTARAAHEPEERRRGHLTTRPKEADHDAQHERLPRERRRGLRRPAPSARATAEDAPAPMPRPSP